MALRVGIVGFETGTHWGGYASAGRHSSAVELAGFVWGRELPDPARETLPDTDVPVYELAGGRPPSHVLELPRANYVFADFCESVVAGRTALMDTADTLATMEADLAVREAARTGERRAVGR